LVTRWFLHCCMILLKNRLANSSCNL